MMQDKVLLAHGGGGGLTGELIREKILSRFGNPALRAMNDSAVLPVCGERVAFTTDSFVVSPWEFPGGNLGDLAVCGTVNDLAMVGATPRYLSLSMILEEGLPLEVLDAVLDAVARRVAECEVQIVCGDTKVVERGQADGLYLNTAGVGVFSFPTNISCSNARPGDRILLSGIPGIHGLAVMLARHASFGLNAALCSDVQPLHGLVRDLLVNGVEVRVLRDLTRGGLTAAVLDIAEHSSVTLEIQQAAVPTTDAQQAACDLLGLDQLTIAGEGCCLLIVPEQQAEQALSVMRRQAAGVNATEIGIVRSSGRQPAELITSLGTRRAMVMPRGEQLPRIC